MASFINALFALLMGVCAEGLEFIDNYNIHAFYYLWYGNEAVDGQYYHWNHEVLPHWTKTVNERHPQIGQRFEPPDHIHSPFYPTRGPYSSRDVNTILEHFTDLRRCKVGVIVLSWWGQESRGESTDTQGVSTDSAVPLVLALAEGAGDIRIAFHLEPYVGRTARSVREDIAYIHAKYGNYSSLLRTTDNRLVFYIYDSYHISPEDWSTVMTRTGKSTIRGTDIDSVIIGLWLHQEHGDQLYRAGFDGVYTYFASAGFSFGSTLRHWDRMCEYAQEVGMLCILSVGPGYRDDKIRPWNAANTKEREDGMYYDRMWSAAVTAGANVVSITSYNEWGEGTQIEPARMNSYLTNTDEEYLDYGTLGSDGYLMKTAEWAEKFTRNKVETIEYVDLNFELV